MIKARIPGPGEECGGMTLMALAQGVERRMITKTAENPDLGNHEPGYEWIAGSTPPNDTDPGKWVVKLTSVWTVLFRSAPTEVEYIVQAFSPDDDGERAAKGMANKLVDIAWESYRNDPRRRNKVEAELW